MNYSALYSFLSERNVKNHLSYMRTLKLKYSILEKSIPNLKGCEVQELFKMNISKKQLNEIVALICKIKAHELYFSSFAKEAKPSEIIRKHYGSENAFCYELIKSAREMDTGYIYIFSDNRGRPIYKAEAELGRSFIFDKPVLLLDLYEHSYFVDYGFEYEKYLRGAISHLDFSRLT